MRLVAAVTKSCLKDFLLMRKTFSLYHPDDSIHALCDKYCYDYLNGNFRNLIAILDSEINDGEHVSGNKDNLKPYLDILSKKFDLCLSLGATPEDPIFWCDVDQIFVNPIEKSIIEGSKYYDAIVTPHYSDDFADEKTVGFFNGGFNIICNPDLFKVWKHLYDRYEELNLYYDQKALEVALRSFKTLNLPINYNFGWWKFMSPKFGGNLRRISSGDDIKWESKPIVSFHFHWFKDVTHSFDRDGLKNIFSSWLSDRGRKEDQETLMEIQFLNNLNE